MSIFLAKLHFNTSKYRAENLTNGVCLQYNFFILMRSVSPTAFSCTTNTFSGFSPFWAKTGKVWVCCLAIQEWNTVCLKSSSSARCPVVATTREKLTFPLPSYRFHSSFCPVPKAFPLASSPPQYSHINLFLDTASTLTPFIHLTHFSAVGFLMGTFHIILRWTKFITDLSKQIWDVSGQYLQEK